MSTRLVAAFRVDARSASEAGALRWRLSGVDRDGAVGDGAIALDVLLNGARDLQLPERLPACELHVSDEFDQPMWELRSAGNVRRFAARSVQVHRGASAAFARALPTVTAPWSVRAGWALLLDALRVPGVASLLRRLRGGKAAGDGQHG